MSDVLRFKHLKNHVINEHPDRLPYDKFLSDREHEISGKDFKNNFMSCMVYVWMRGKTCMYVGMSRVGFHRPCNPDHHIMDKNDIDDADIIRIIYTKCAEDAYELESELIKKLQPKFNK